MDGKLSEVCRVSNAALIFGGPNSEFLSQKAEGESKAKNLHREENLRWTKLLNAEFGQPLTHVDAGFHRLALYDTSAEATSEGITVNLSRTISAVS